MRIVTDGKQFAIQKGWIFKRYLSLYDINNWWSLKRSYEFCWGNKERIEDLYNFMIRKKNIKVVKKE